MAAHRPDPDDDTCVIDAATTHARLTQQPYTPPLYLMPGIRAPLPPRRMPPYDDAPTLPTTRRTPMDVLSDVLTGAVVGMLVAFAVFATLIAVGVIR